MENPQAEAGKMDRLLDRPIDTTESDLLGFVEVAQSLIDTITAQPNNSSLTLGLDGSWGSGKSSILKLMHKSLDKDSSEGAVGLVVVSFSPWLITNRTALVSAFFAQILDAITKAEKRLPRNWSLFRKGAAKKLSQARKQLNRFSKVVSIASTAATPFDPTMVSAVAAGSSTAVTQLTDQSGKPDKTLEALKIELTDALAGIAKEDASFKILVLIDDLDRLDPGDALEVLRLVKAVGDFPAITYLLAYDRSAIARAIEHSAKIDDGDAYLEKIIQFSFKVPPLEPFQLRNWLKGELEQLYPGDIDVTSARASAVLDRWAGRLMTTPRDVKRLLFAVRAIWPKLQGRADLVDLIWLQMIAQKASDKDKDLYSWIVGYLQGLEAIAIGGTVNGKDEERERLVKILKRLGWAEFEHGKKAWSIDFHHLDELLAGITQDHLSSSGDDDWTYKVNDSLLQTLRQGKRLSSPWHWRLYFALGTPSHAITDDEWEALLQAAENSTETLSEALKKVLEFRGEQRRDAADQILGLAAHSLTLSALPYADRWLAAIARQAAAMESRSKKDSLFGFSRLFEANFRVFARLVFKALSGTERDTALLAIFREKEIIGPASNLIRDQFHAAQKTDFERDEKFYLSDSELNDAVAAQLELYEKITPDEFRSLSSPYDVLFAWRDISNSDSGPKGLLETAMQTDADLISTLSSLRYVSSSAQKGIPHIPENFLSPFLDTKALKARLETLSENDSPLGVEARHLLELWWGPD
jgi:hypothetical protein